MSTSEPITISYRWDRENFEKAFENAYAYHYKNSARRYIGWLFVAMAQFGVVAALKKGSAALLIFSTIVLFYWYIVKKWLLRRRAMRYFESAPLKDREITLTVNDEEIMQDGKPVRWEEIEGVVPTTEGLMLYQKGREFYIPASAFRSIEAMSRFKSIAREKGKLYV